MVFKNEKHGVRTGNTFKRWNTKYFRKYSNMSYIVRSHINREHREGDDYDDFQEFQKTSAFGEGESMKDGIFYSLNKQGRWELPTLLETQIKHGDHEEDYGIELVERHRVNQMANCVSVCSTSGVYKNGKIDKDTKHVGYKTTSGYCQSNSVLKNSNKRKKNRRRRRARDGDQMNGDDVTEDVREENKLRYEVLHPVPSDSYLSHMHKKIGNETYSFVWNGYQSKNQRSKRHEQFDNHIRESLEFMDDSFDDSDEENNVHAEDLESFDDVNQIDYDVTLDDILRHANTANKLASGKRRLNSDSSASSADTSSAKNNFVYVERKDEVNTLTSEQSKKMTTKSSAILEPIRVILADDLVSPEVLVETYGKNYVECECFPRKFILNISDRLTQSSGRKTSTQSQLRQAEACLVFVHDVENEINNPNENVYKVFLNGKMSRKLSSLRIETIFDYMEATVDELIERSLFFIETLPEEIVVYKTETKSFRKETRQTPFEQLADWSSKPYSPDSRFLLDYFVKRGTVDTQDAVDMGYEVVDRFNQSEATDHLSDSITSLQDQFCCICYLPLDASTPGTALVKCSHWFCDVCWKEYLETRVADGAISLQCPEFECDTVVDPGTVLSLINLRDVIRHAKCCHDTEVEQLAVTKWCPNEKCGRVLKINSEQTKTCHCLCGFKACFDCLDPPHWPASCDSVKKYYKILRKSGDIGLEPPELRPPIIVRGKNCPSCHRFVEKNGGCPFMTCVCNAHFCWGCGQMWDSRQHGSDCYSHGYKNEHGTTERKFEQKNLFDDNKSTRQKWYKMAVIHRVNQHPRRVGKLKSAVKPLSRKIQGYLYKSEKSNQPVKLNFELSDKTFDHEYEKASHFVKTLVDLYVEANQVIENTAVVLSSDQAMTSKDAAVLKRISRRLSSFSDKLYETFKYHDAIDAKIVVHTFIDVRFHSEKTLQSLIRYINSMKL